VPTNSPHPIITDQIIIPSDIGPGYEICFNDRVVGPFPSRSSALAVGASAGRREREHGSGHLR
jgi:hypothetical protein